jgi:hypothetical protein
VRDSAESAETEDCLRAELDVVVVLVAVGTDCGVVEATLSGSMMVRQLGSGKILLLMTSWLVCTPSSRVTTLKGMPAALHVAMVTFELVGPVKGMPLAICTAADVATHADTIVRTL